MDEQLRLVQVTRIGLWAIHIDTGEGPRWLGWLYYFLKLDHLLCVPALAFLLTGLAAPGQVGRTWKSAGRGRHDGYVFPHLDRRHGRCDPDDRFLLLCLRFVRRLKRRDEENVIWTYLLWMCYGLTAFAVSRSAGHILKQVFFLFGDRNVWENLRPFTGAINTFMLVFVASVTLFFERVWRLYQQILKDKQALQAAHQELLYLNQNLETWSRSAQRPRWLRNKSTAAFLKAPRT